MNRIYFRANDNGQMLSGYVMLDELEEALRGDPKKIKFYYNGFESKIYWYIVKSAPGVIEYVKNNLPEYTI